MTKRFQAESQEAYKIRRAYEKTLQLQMLNGTIATKGKLLNRTKRRALEFHDVKHQLQTKIEETIEFGEKLHSTSRSIELVCAKRTYLKYRATASNEWLSKHLTDVVRIVDSPIRSLAAQE